MNAKISGMKCNCSFRMQFSNEMAENKNCTHRARTQTGRDTRAHNRTNEINFQLADRCFGRFGLRIKQSVYGAHSSVERERVFV